MLGGGGGGGAIRWRLVCHYVCGTTCYHGNLSRVTYQRGAWVLGRISAMAKAAASGGVRESIQTLSSVLAGLGVLKIPSEVFRQAKFNHPAAFNSMLNLLYQSTSILSMILSSQDRPLTFCPTTEQIEAVIAPLPSLEEEAQGKAWMLLHVQKLFLQLGYTRQNFYCHCNSRELLLCLGWLVFKIQFLSKLQACVLHSACEPLLPISSTLQVLLENIQVEQINLKEELTRVDQSLRNNTYDVGLLQKLVFD